MLFVFKEGGDFKLRSKIMVIFYKLLGQRLICLDLVLEQYNQRLCAWTH